MPSREQRHLGSRKRENVGGPLSHVLQTLVRFELRSSSSAPLLWCQKPGRLKHLGLLYLICSLFSNCIPKLLAKLLKIIQLLRQIMSSTLDRATGEGAEYLQLRSGEESVSDTEHEQLPELTQETLQSNCPPCCLFPSIK